MRRGLRLLLMALVCALPLMEALLEMVEGFL